MLSALKFYSHRNLNKLFFKINIIYHQTKSTTSTGRNIIFEMVPIMRQNTTVIPSWRGNDFRYQQIHPNSHIHKV